MQYHDAVERLWNHANMPAAGLMPEDSFIHTAHDAAAPEARARLQRLFRDILSCLDSANVALNGQVPSEHVDSAASAIDRKLCYSVSGILSSGWSQYYGWWRLQTTVREFLDEFGSMLVRIGIAWDFVLAGDSDDIIGETEQEFAAEQA